MSRDELRAAIRGVLTDYRCQYTLRSDDDDGMPLVELMCDGRNEIDLLADEIAAEVGAVEAELRGREERLEKALRETDGLSWAFEKQIMETRRYDLSKSRVLDYAKAVRKIARAALGE